MSGSIRLEGQAEATLLALSDLLTSDISAENTSYLSGYPLKDANRYVLTRTWLAPESPRPGSVWSHSLILEYPALTLIEDLASLLRLFRRPQGATDPHYAQPIPAAALTRSQPGDDSFHMGGVARDRAETVLRALYGQSGVRSLSLAAENSLADETLAVAVWRQMWPGLRRDFAFFTRVRGEVGEVSAGFALNLRTDEFHAPASSTSASSDRAAFDVLWRDLAKPGPTELRRFLGRYAYDAPDPRRIVPDLVLMHERKGEPASVALDLAGRYAGAATLPRLKRDILLQAIHSDDAEVVAEVVGALRNEPLVVSEEEVGELVSGSVKRDRSAVGRIIAAASPSKEGELGEAVLRAIVFQASTADLAEAQIGVEIRHKLLRLRPELAAESAFWPQSPADRAGLLELALNTVELPTVLLTALGARMTPSEALAILSRYGVSAELPVFELLRGRLPDQEAWSVIRHLLRRPGFVQREAQQERQIGLPLLDAMVGELLPDVPLAPEDWLKVAKREAGGGALTATAPNLASGLFMAALSAPMPLAARLVEVSFDAVYEGLDRWTFPSRLREVLEGQLGRRSKEWRLVDKLVAAVIDCYGGPDRADPHLLLVTARGDALGEIVERIERKGPKGALQGLAARAEAQRRPEFASRIQHLRAEIARKNARWTW